MIGHLLPTPDADYRDNASGAFLGTMRFGVRIGTFGHILFGPVGRVNRLSLMDAAEWARMASRRKRWLRSTDKSRRAKRAELNRIIPWALPSSSTP
jgi:hypothetical protein